MNTMIGHVCPTPFGIVVLPFPFFRECGFSSAARVKHLTRSEAIRGTGVLAGCKELDREKLSPAIVRRARYGVSSLSGPNKSGVIRISSFRLGAAAGDHHL